MRNSFSYATAPGETSRIAISKINSDLLDGFYAKSMSRMTIGAMAHAESKEQPVAHWMRMPKNRITAAKYPISFLLF